MRHCPLWGRWTQRCEPDIESSQVTFLLENMDQDVQDCIRNCLHCTVSKGGLLVPRPFGNTLEALRPNHVHLADWIKIRDPTPEHPFGYLLVEVDKHTKLFEVTAAESSIGLELSLWCARDSGYRPRHTFCQ